MPCLAVISRRPFLKRKQRVVDLGEKGGAGELEGVGGGKPVVWTIIHRYERRCEIQII